MNQTIKTGMLNNSNCNNIPILVIFAPTACGKTALAEHLFSKNANSIFAKKAEIISADSMQVYKELNIGTAKPDFAFLENLPHHLIDICNITEQFDTGHFVDKAELAAKEIYSNHKMPVLLGGTAFYIKNFLFGLPITPEPTEEVRKLVETRMETEGAEVLYSELQKLDPNSANKIHINDKYRIRRALEVCLTTGKPRSSFEIQQNFRQGFDFFVISLNRPRTELYRRIERRVDIMLEQGLLDEINSLKSKGYTGTEPGLQAIGYKEFFASETDLQKIVQSIKHNTKRYAKRQETFFNAMNCSIQFHAEDFSSITKAIQPFFAKYF